MATSTSIPVELSTIERCKCVLFFFFWLYDYHETYRILLNVSDIERNNMQNVKRSGSLCIAIVILCYIYHCSGSRRHKEIEIVTIITGAKKQL